MAQMPQENMILTDDAFMQKALELATRGEGWVHPNPLVGAVLVKDGCIIGQGWHHACGQLHAEREALSDCAKRGKDPRDATMYITLEPCCHEGRQPPCTDAIIESALKRVVVASDDPNPLVSGRGYQALSAAGIEVERGVLKEQADALNEVFMHYMSTKRPFVVMKYAMTLDGKTACRTGKSQWITSQTARQHVHLLRNRYTAIMCGVGTVLADDPMLTCRIEGGSNPVRIICDTRLGTPLSARLVRTAHEFETIIACSVPDETRQAPYLAAGCEIMCLPRRGDHLDLDALICELGKREIDSVLLEGGSTLNWAFVKRGLINKVCAYVAPKIFGGKKAKTAVGGKGYATPERALQLVDMQLTQLGDDWLIEARVRQE